MQKRTIIAGLGIAAALVVAGSTGAVAGSLVSSAQIQDDSVRSIDVKDQTLRLKDIRPDAVKHLQGQAGTNGVNGAPGADGTNGVDGTNGTNGVDGTNGTNGTNGAPGADGAKGADGAPGTTGKDGGLSGFEKKIANLNVDDNGVHSLTVNCSPGKIALGGGSQFGDLHTSFPSYGIQSGWTITASDAMASGLTAWVLCANPAA